MEKNNLKEVALLFLKLGIIGFGGPAVHIAMMQNEIVTKRKWMTTEHFMDLVGATNLIPGPNSTEMAIHIGYERAGRRGMILAGICFILPAVIITGIFAWLYKQYGQLPEVQSFVYGIKPAIIVIVIAAVIPLAKISLKSYELALTGIAILILSLYGINEIYLMFGAGLLALSIRAVKAGKKKYLKNLFPLTILQITVPAVKSVTGINLFLIFLKIGAILYGSGYVLFAFLDTELVSTGILTRNQLIDAIAAGQLTPGPLFSAVTFIGYQISGLSGAIISTAGIFLPSFIFVAFLNPLVKKMRNSVLFPAFLDAVNVASVALIISVCISMGSETVTDWRTITIAVMSILIMFLIRNINTAVIVLFGSLSGFLLTLI